MDRAAEVPAPPPGTETVMAVLEAEAPMHWGKATPRTPWPEETKTYWKLRVPETVPTMVTLTATAVVVPPEEMTKPQMELERPETAGREEERAPEVAVVEAVIVAELGGRMP